MHESLSFAPPFFQLATSTVVHHDWCFKCKDIHEHSIKPEINWIKALYINIVVPCPFLSTKRGHLWDQYIPSCSNLNMPISWLSSPAHIFSACSDCSEGCKLSFFQVIHLYLCSNAIKMIHENSMKNHPRGPLGRLGRSSTTEVSGGLQQIFRAPGSALTHGWSVVVDRCRRTPLHTHMQFSMVLVYLPTFKGAF